MRFGRQVVSAEGAGNFGRRREDGESVAADRGRTEARPYKTYDGWSEVVESLRENFAHSPENWRRRDESNIGSCRIGNVDSTCPTLAKQKI